MTSGIRQLCRWPWRKSVEFHPNLHTRRSPT